MKQAPVTSEKVDKAIFVTFITVVCLAEFVGLVRFVLIPLYDRLSTDARIVVVAFVLSGLAALVAFVRDEKEVNK